MAHDARTDFENCVRGYLFAQARTPIQSAAEGRDGRRRLREKIENVKDKLWRASLVLLVSRLWYGRRDGDQVAGCAPGGAGRPVCGRADDRGGAPELTLARAPAAASRLRGLSLPPSSLVGRASFGGGTEREGASPDFSH
jgi:hypothetical protein